MGWWRTNETSLSDDELMLFDALWDGDCAWWMLRRDAYPQITTLPHTHQLNDDTLTATLQTLAVAGLIRAYLYAYAEGDDKRYYGLTADGGWLWQRERLPDWMRYFHMQEIFTDDGRWLWQVESPSPETAEAVARWSFKTGNGAPPFDDLTRVDKPNWRFLPWMDFPMITELTGTYTIGDADATIHPPGWSSIVDLLP